MHRSVPLLLLLTLSCSPTLQAATREALDADVQAALTRMTEAIPAGNEFLQRAVGVLVFPRVLKAGFGLGGEVGEGALLVSGETVQYYRTTGLSFGFQIGVSARTEVILFMTPEVLAGFQASQGWKAGVDGGIAVLTWGVAKDVTTQNVREPVVAFLFDNKGLMYDVSLEGSRYWKIAK